MTTPRRRLLRPAPPVDDTEIRRERRHQRQAARLEQERAGFDRWMTRLRRACREIAKRQKRIARLERVLARPSHD
jgi:truncated hemoglobin YjbI